jgi:hypothetical protein
MIPSVTAVVRAKPRLVLPGEILRHRLVLPGGIAKLPLVLAGEAAKAKKMGAVEKYGMVGGARYGIEA